jgi:hypothetical protein
MGEEGITGHEEAKKSPLLQRPSRCCICGEDLIRWLLSWTGEMEKWKQSRALASYPDRGLQRQRWIHITVRPIRQATA